MDAKDVPAVWRKRIECQKRAVTVEIMRTSGARADSFQTLSSMFYRRAHAIVLVYDITSRDSFDKLDQFVQTIVQAREVEAPSSVPLVLCGNKNDLSRQRQVAAQDAHAFSAQICAELYETSAMTGLHIDTIFDAAVRAVLARDPKSKDDKCTVM